MSDSHVRLVQELTPVVAAAGADLEELSLTRAGRRSVVRVVIDAHHGVSLDDVATVSRALSEALDELDAREPALLAGAYVLEVSSPGVDRPLTVPRHWQRSVGRLVTVVLHAGEPVTGRLTAADADVTGGLTVEREGASSALPYASVLRGAVQVEFNRPDGEPDGLAESDLSGAPDLETAEEDLA